MNEKNQTEVESRTGALQRGAQTKVTTDPEKEVVKECEAEEARLFSLRGYGGYIKTEHLAAVRATRKEAEERIAERGQER